MALAKFHDVADTLEMLLDEAWIFEILSRLMSNTRSVLLTLTFTLAEQRNPKPDNVSTKSKGPLPDGKEQPTSDPKEKSNSENGTGIEERPDGTEKSTCENGTGTEET